MLRVVLATVSDCVGYGWQCWTVSVPVPPVVEDRGGVGVSFGSFPYALCEHIGYVGRWCVWVQPEVIGYVVQRVVKQRNCSELVRGLDVGVTEEPAVEVGEELWW